VSIVTGLSLLGGDVTGAVGLNQQQQQFLRQWLSKTQQNNNSQLRVVWQPPPGNQAVSRPQPKPPRLAGRQLVLKAGYAGAQPEAAPMQQQPAQVRYDIRLILETLSAQCRHITRPSPDLMTLSRHTDYSCLWDVRLHQV